ncbi:unannotated protein [freshwater metagenome]|uniref:Unannotated protein n=1 Tax=freshwater metagenome TaxID=449393 RepID=A0A6J6B784_9ZZZZ|nr:twin-arginine translocase subunit TatC [Actinomycetota bacterium]
MARRKNPDAKMSLGGHFRELRKRLFWSALFIAVGAVAGWYFYPQFFEILMSPLNEIASRRGDVKINFSGVMSAFDLQLQVSIFLGVMAASPVWLFNLWAFITPALKKRERRYTIGFLASALPLFFAGVWLAWVSLPAFMTTLISFTPSSTTNFIVANDYILFVLRILLVFGLAFVMPVVLVLLNLAGLITSRSIFKSWRLAVFLIAVIAALATPTADPLSMFVLMAPLTALYFASGGVAWITDRRRRKQLGQDVE